MSGQLSNLTHLFLSENQLQEVPDSIGQLSNLTSLDLEHNQLQKLPNPIGQLNKLAELDLSENQLQDSEKERIKKILPNCTIYF